MSDLVVRPAEPGDLGVVEELLTGASEWLASRGIDQWQYPPHRDRISAAIAVGTVYLFSRESGEVVATLQLDDLADSEFWGQEDRPHDALYVHRMAVRRDAAGGGLGAYMLDWAAEQTAQAGKQWLRLDAWKDNPGLHEFYERTGFHLVRIVDLSHRRSGALFQRPV